MNNQVKFRLGEKKIFRYILIISHRNIRNWMTEFHLCEEFPTWKIRTTYLNNYQRSTPKFGRTATIA